MGTQVLHPQEYFFTPTPASFSYRSNHYGYNNNRAATSKSHRKPVTRPAVKKRDSTLVLKRSSADDSVTAKSREKVTILRRGKSLDSSLEAVKSDKYAGSAFSMSPSPSALPLPSFLMKKQFSATVDDSATRDLRRLLRLD
ncbi:uncharacterized protein LOC131631960 [Vicia villosa]|uniref:uncharacterized protein LOC131631960 n=1 Tax=Vicia villosa TaxID=3911 RepID=UPI00273AC287|nr:uncharacterized protein LOC131631960 [Vicia villosa]